MRRMSDEVYEDERRRKLRKWREILYEYTHVFRRRKRKGLFVFRFKIYIDFLLDSTTMTKYVRCVQMRSMLCFVR